MEVGALTLLHSVWTTLTQIDEIFDGQMSQSHSFSNMLPKVQFGLLHIQIAVPIDH